MICEKPPRLTTVAPEPPPRSDKTIAEGGGPVN